MRQGRFWSWRLRQVTTLPPDASSGLTSSRGGCWRRAGSPTSPPWRGTRSCSRRAAAADGRARPRHPGRQQGAGRGRHRAAVVTEIQKDVGRIKDTIGQRELEEKAAQARLAALEERVTTMAATPVAQATPEPAPPTVTTAKSRSERQEQSHGREAPDRRRAAARADPHHLASPKRRPARAGCQGARGPRAEARDRAAQDRNRQHHPRRGHHLRRARGHAGRAALRRAARGRAVARRPAPELEPAGRAPRPRSPRCSRASWRRAKTAAPTACSPAPCPARPTPTRSAPTWASASRAASPPPSSATRC